MSSYLVLSAVSEALRDILWDDFDADPTVRPIVGSKAGIVFKNPTETALDSSNRLSLWLYQVTENEFVKNQPMQRGTAADTGEFPPLALNFFFLITPFAQSGGADHMLLGKTLQSLYDNASVLLRDTASDIYEELRIIFCRLTLEELTRIWDALKEPYRLSVCWKVTVTRIDSNRAAGFSRVVERTSGVGPTPELATV